MDYRAVNSLEEVHEFTMENIPLGGSEYHYNIKYRINISDLKKEEDLLDVKRTAENWSGKTCPSNYEFNHGQYIYDGILEIVEELKNKSSSNRALVSLIGDRSNFFMNDNPIPSFLLLQFNLSENGRELFISAYYRALEVGSFLRINLSELKIYTLRVFQEIRTINECKFSIYASRAYHSKDDLCLEKPAIYSEVIGEITAKIYNDIKNVIPYFEGLAKSRTRIDVSRIDDVCSIVENYSGVDDIIKKKISDMKDLAKKLAEERERSSHGTLVEEIYKKFCKSVEDLCSEIDRTG